MKNCKSCRCVYWDDFFQKLLFFFTEINTVFFFFFFYQNRTFCRICKLKSKNLLCIFSLTANIRGKLLQISLFCLRNSIFTAFFPNTNYMSEHIYSTLPDEVMLIEWMIYTNSSLLLQTNERKANWVCVKRIV